MNLIIFLFPYDTEVETLCANAGDASLIPGLGTSPVGGNGKSLQYSCLQNPIDKEDWLATVHGITKRQDLAAKQLQHALALFWQAVELRSFGLSRIKFLHQTNYEVWFDLIPKHLAHRLPAVCFPLWVIVSVSCVCFVWLFFSWSQSNMDSWCGLSCFPIFIISDSCSTGIMLVSLSQLL